MFYYIAMCTVHAFFNPTSIHQLRFLPMRINSRLHLERWCMVCQYDRCSLNSDLEFWVISQDKAQIWWVALSFSGSPDKYRTSGTKGEQPRQTPRYFHKNHCSSLSPKTRRCSISLSRDAMTVRCWLKE